MISPYLSVQLFVLSYERYAAAVRPLIFKCHQIPNIQATVRYCYKMTCCRNKGNKSENNKICKFNLHTPFFSRTARTLFCHLLSIQKGFRVVRAWKSPITSLCFRVLLLVLSRHAKSSHSMEQNYDNLSQSGTSSNGCLSKWKGKYIWQ